MPPLMMTRYAVPDDLAVETATLADLPQDWRTRESWTQARGDAWSDTGRTPLLRAPSVIVPLEESPDMNLVINHRHPDAARIRIDSVEPFALDARLL